MVPRRLPIHREALQVAGSFFEERGVHGYEGTAMLAGTEAEGVSRCVIPEQLAFRGLNGEVSVEVTDEGKLTLASSLALDERYFARIHSHPAEAFHSPTDDLNPGLTAQGSLSIVCPFFGLGLRRGLEACAIFVLHERMWVEIPVDLIESFVSVIDD
jgi:hypothetical protein